MKQPISPLPWTIDNTIEEFPIIIQDNDDGMAVVDFIPSLGERQDLEYIVEACNNYPKVIQFLEGLCSSLIPVAAQERPSDLWFSVRNFLNSIENECNK